MKEYTVKFFDHCIEWWFNGKLHREDGPAVQFLNGDKWWDYDENGKKIYREGRPAIEHDCGAKYWYIEGKRHREDGPAVEFSNGTKYWYLDGILLSKQEFLDEINKKASNTVIRKYFDIKSGNVADTATDFSVCYTDGMLQFLENSVFRINLDTSECNKIGSKLLSLIDTENEPCSYRVGEANLYLKKYLVDSKEVVQFAFCSGNNNSKCDYGFTTSKDVFKEFAEWLTKL